MVPVLGALIGDIAGSVYEWKNIKTKDFPLVRPDCRMTDDSVMTAAVAAALLTSNFQADLPGFRTRVVAEMQRLGRLYPRAGYGLRFRTWLQSEDPQPYYSLGNGSGMRVSPVAWAAESLEECLTLAKASAEVTHDHPDGIAGACAVAGAVYLARMGEDKAAIRDFVTGYYPLDFTLDQIRPDYEFDVSCAGSVPQAIQAFLEGESFEDTIRNAISLGGDSDTIAAMAGSVAAAHFGIPRAIRDQFLPFIDGEVRNIYDRFIQRY
jgi:type I restriction enzyme M protein